MSGHSRWKQIKHKKDITDKKRGRLFSKISKLISLAARKGTNPEVNIDLKNAIYKAREVNMPNENVQRAVNKVSDKSATRLEELLIEAVGPGGIALKIKAITDNHNRTIAEIKKLLSDYNSKMVLPGSISWIFNQPVALNETAQRQVSELFEALDEQADVEDVISNLN